MRVTAGFIALLLVAGVATAAPFAYVPNEGSATVSVIDTASDRVTKTITTGGKPRGIAINQSEARALLCKQLGAGAADARARSGDEGGLLHCVTPR